MSTYIQLDRQVDDSIEVQEDVSAVVSRLDGGSASDWRIFILVDGRKCAVMPKEVRGIWEVPTAS